MIASEARGLPDSGTSAVPGLSGLPGVPGVPGLPGVNALVAGRMLAQTRREMAAHSLLVFARLYLERVCTLPFCEAHRCCAALIEAAARERNHRIALSLPMQHGKTALFATAHALWAVCARGEPHVVIVRATPAQAVESLRDIGLELGSGALLADYPRAAPQRATSREIVTRSGAVIRAVAYGESLLGNRVAGAGPSLVILDDVEQPKVRGEWGHPDHRPGPFPRELEDWMEGWMKRRLARGANVLVVGSLVDPGCLLARLIDHNIDDGWRRYSRSMIGAFGATIPEELKQIKRQGKTYRGHHGMIACVEYLLDHLPEIFPDARATWPERLACGEFRGLVRERELACAGVGCELTWNHGTSNGSDGGSERKGWRNHRRLPVFECVARPADGGRYAVTLDLDRKRWPSHAVHPPLLMVFEHPGEEIRAAPRWGDGRLIHPHDNLKHQTLTDLRSLRWMWEEELERREREAARDSDAAAPASAPTPASAEGAIENHRHDPAAERP